MYINTESKGVMSSNSANAQFTSTEQTSTARATNILRLRADILGVATAGLGDSISFGGGGKGRATATNKKY